MGDGDSEMLQAQNSPYSIYTALQSEGIPQEAGLFG